MHNQPDLFIVVVISFNALRCQTSSVVWLPEVLAADCDFPAEAAADHVAFIAEDVPGALPCLIAGAREDDGGIGPITAAVAALMLRWLPLRMIEGDDQWVPGHTWGRSRRLRAGIFIGTPDTD